MVERSRAGRRLADLTAREQRRLGEELHEGLSQQVTGLAMLARSLHRRLVDRDSEEVDLAAELVENLETARSQVRDLPKGLVAEHLGARSVVEALEELADNALVHAQAKTVGGGWHTPAMQALREGSPWRLRPAERAGRRGC